MLLEGLGVSFDVLLTLSLAERHEVVVLTIQAPPRDCAVNLMRRQRLGRTAEGRLLSRVEEEGSAIAGVCRMLSPNAAVHAAASTTSFGWQRPGFNCKLVLERAHKGRPNRPAVAAWNAQAQGLIRPTASRPDGPARTTTPSPSAGTSPVSAVMLT